MEGAEFFAIKENEDRRSFQAQIWFLSEVDLYKTEKPYRLRFESPDPQIPRTNIETNQASKTIRDLRYCSEPLTYERNGFAVLEAETAFLTTEDCADGHRIDQLYLRKLNPLLCDFFGTEHVVMLEYLIRKRDQSFPISHGGDYENNQPVMLSHVDWTPQHVESRVRRFMGAEADKIIAGRYQYVHVWKPLKGPVKDWPLALCDISSVDPRTDIEESDTVFDSGNYVEENYQVYNRPYHRWFYISDQKTSELTIFRQYDSTIGHGSGVPHVAFPNPKSNGDAEPRESIEVQCLVYWDNA